MLCLLGHYYRKTPRLREGFGGTKVLKYQLPALMAGRREKKRRPADQRLTKPRRSRPTSHCPSYRHARTHAQHPNLSRNLITHHPFPSKTENVKTTRTCARHSRAIFSIYIYNTNFSRSVSSKSLMYLFEFLL